MAYVGTTNTLIANGGSADYLFVIKQTLVAAGWQIVLSSNGVAAPTAADNLPTAAAFNAANAWCRLREPTGGPTTRREYVLQHGAAGSAVALVKYSRATGFGTGGTATASPTTGVGGDGQIIVGASTATAESAATSGVGNGGTICGTTGYVQCVASNTATAGTNGTFGWWAFQYPVGGGTYGNAFLFHEPIAVGSTPSTDQDPSATYFISNASGASSPTIIGSTNTLGITAANFNGWAFWEAYGLAGAAYRRNNPGNIFVTYNNTIGSGLAISWPYFGGSLSPYDGKVTMTPILVGGAANPGTVTRTLFKGYSTGILTFQTTQNFVDTFNLSSADPRVCVQNANSTISVGNCAIPWVTSVVPLV